MPEELKADRRKVHQHSSERCIEGIVAIAEFGKPGAFGLPFRIALR
jgi:hypothetical protein